MKCDLCERGFPRNDKTWNHYGTQKLGMIPNTPCKMPSAPHGGRPTDKQVKEWMGYDAPEDEITIFLSGYDTATAKAREEVERRQRLLDDEKELVTGLRNRIGILERAIERRNTALDDINKINRELRSKLAEAREAVDYWMGWLFP